ncbi:MAG: TetR/AcrR family transcriptional regulator [Anaerolineaceae bacterium]|nr:TetR/AcrR family transcriptional regulator [Anaerolineaceae bacterium]
MDTGQVSPVREKILTEASRLFAARGVERVSMREIAAEVGLSKPGLYYYFEDKETLVLSILVQNLEYVAALVERAVEVAPDARFRLAHITRGFFAMAPEQREMIQLASRHFPTLSLPARKAFDRIYQQNFILKIQAILSEGMRRDELREVDPLLATWAFLGMLYPFFSSTGKGKADPTEELLTLFMDGMKKG